jgi:hypothetical protein
MRKQTVVARLSRPKVDRRLDGEIERTMQHSLVSSKFHRAQKRRGGFQKNTRPRFQ